MIKKLAIGIIVSVFIYAAYYAYGFYSTRNLSPKETIQFSEFGLDISITYGRPYKKGRLIFGYKGEGALVPYDKYWRLGANEATEITFSRDVKFSGVDVKAGSYRMYAIPKDGEWKIVLNAELGKWGAWEADHDYDVATGEAYPLFQKEGEPIEQFTIEIAEGGDGALINFKWDRLIVSIPVK